MSAPLLATTTTVARSTTTAAAPSSWNDFSYYILPIAATFAATATVKITYLMTDQILVMTVLAFVFMLSVIVLHEFLSRRFLANDNVIDGAENMNLTFLNFLKWFLGILLAAYIANLVTDALESAPLPNWPVVLTLVVLLVLNVIMLSRFIGDLTRPMNSKTVATKDG
jgi:hypothetical protein